MPARNILGILNVPPLWTANTNSPPTRSEPHAPCCAGRACDLPPRRISAKRRSANWKMARGNRIPARSQLSAGPSRAAEFCLRPKEAHPYRILKGQRPPTTEAGAGGEQTARGRILRQEQGLCVGLASMLVGFPVIAADGGIRGLYRLLRGSSSKLKEPAQHNGPRRALYRVSLWTRISSVGLVAMTPHPT